MPKIDVVLKQNDILETPMNMLHQSSGGENIISKYVFFADYGDESFVIVSRNILLMFRNAIVSQNVTLTFLAIVTSCQIRLSIDKRLSIANIR